MVLPMQKKNSVKKIINRGSIISVLVLSSEVLQLFAGILTCSTKSGSMVEEMTYWRNKKLISAYLGLVCILLLLPESRE